MCLQFLKKSALKLLDRTVCVTGEIKFHSNISVKILASNMCSMKP